MLTPYQKTGSTKTKTKEQEQNGTSPQARAKEKKGFHPLWLQCPEDVFSETDLSPLEKLITAYIYTKEETTRAEEKAIRKKDISYYLREKPETVRTLLWKLKQKDWVRQEQHDWSIPQNYKYLKINKERLIKRSKKTGKPIFIKIPRDVANGTLGKENDTRLPAQQRLLVSTILDRQQKKDKNGNNKYSGECIEWTRNIGKRINRSRSATQRNITCLTQKEVLEVRREALCLGGRIVRKAVSVAKELVMVLINATRRREREIGFTKPEIDDVWQKDVKNEEIDEQIREKVDRVVTKTANQRVAREMTREKAYLRKQEELKKLWAMPA